MSETTSADPYGTAFELWRRSVETTRRATHQNAAVQRRMVAAAVDNADAGMRVQRKGTDLVRVATEATVESAIGMVPGDAAVGRNVVDAVDNQFDAADEVTEQTGNAIARSIEESGDAYADALDAYETAADEAFDGYLDLIDWMETTFRPRGERTAE